MDIVFMMKHAGSARNLESVLRELDARGHRVHLALDRQDASEAPGLLERLTAELPRLTVGPGPKGARAPWSPLARSTRSAIDYLRYLEPRYATAEKLRDRAREAAPPRFRTAADRLPLRRPGARRLLHRLLRLHERALPAPPRAVDWLARRSPDVVCVVPLLGLGAAQTDYVRAARALGIPSVLPVFSWDNLTNKGMLHELPDLVTVWNSAQAQEAVQLHSVPEHRVEITGAPAFDHWFAWGPGRDRAAFAAELGLSPDQAIVLYLCSSPFIAPDEVGFVRDWLGAIRGSPVRELSDAGVIVRPHPQNAAQWQSADLGDARAVVWPAAGANPVSDTARADFFDSLHHAAAAVGINTTALIESAIVDRPVLSVLDGRFAGTQEGTLHFRHLADAGTGVLSVDRTLGDHVDRLAAAIAGDNWWSERNRRFLAGFVRPHGLDQAAGPRVADAIERAGRAGALPQPRVQRAAHAAVRRAVSGAAPAAPPKRPKAPQPDPVAQARAAVAELAAGNGPIIAGPWTSEVGYELLYWVPFLRWAVEEHPELRSRLTVLSRGGVDAWYAGLGVHYQELFDLLAPEELDHRLEAARAAGDGLRKQMAHGPLEQELVAMAAAASGGGAPSVLSPSLMYRALRALTKRRALVDSSESRDLFRHRPLADPGRAALAGRLPERYVAVRFYFRASLPDSAENIRWARAAVEALAEDTHVVLLNPDRRYDDHADLEATSGGRVVTIADRMEPRTNLAVQTAAIAGATAFVGTYGGLSYLPCVLGVPSFAVHSDPTRYKAHHLELAQRVFAEDGFGRLAVTDARTQPPSAVLGAAAVS